MKKLIFLFFAVSLLFSCGTKHEPKTIYVVRHAEKRLDSEDPVLNVAGTVRSKKLSQILSDKNIAHIFSTQTLRTTATATPLATQNQLQIQIYDVQKHDDLVEKLRTYQGNILVVSHSNIIHHLVNYFIGEEEPFTELNDIEYDFIFEIELKPDGSSSVHRKLYKEY